MRKRKTDIYQVNRKNKTVTAMSHLKVYSPTVTGDHLIAMKGLGDHRLSYGADFFHEDFSGRKRRIAPYDTQTGITNPGAWTQVERKLIRAIGQARASFVMTLMATCCNLKRRVYFQKAGIKVL